MPRRLRIRKRRGTCWTSESSARANKARWDAVAKQREAEQEARDYEREFWESINLPRRQGDALGALQWTDFRTGRVRRWVIRIGDRADRVTMETADGRRTQSHGWTWVLERLRGYLCGRLG